MLLDAIGSRYSKLPTEVLKNADSFDLMVFDVAITNEIHQAKKQNNEVDTKMYDQKDLEEQFYKTTGRERENKI